jgi:uncharacterized membrane protein (DUF485 family)
MRSRSLRYAHSSPDPSLSPPVSPVSNDPLPHSSDGPPLPHVDDDPEVASAHARVGLWLFGIYLLLYTGFMGLNAFTPGLMAWTPGGGLNLAVLYGMGLIFAAVALAFVYMGACRWIAGRHGHVAGRRQR